MRKAFGIILLVFGVCSFFTILVVGLCGGFPPSHYDHAGKVLLTEQEYQGFKAAMAAPEITSLEVTMLNHDYPMLLEYKFMSNSDIPIMENEKVANVPSYLTLLCLLGLIPIVYGFIVYPEEK